MGYLLLIMASNGANSSAQVPFSIDMAEPLKDILEAFKAPENQTLLEKAKEDAGSDMLKSMQFAFPVTTQIQMQVIPNYGFSGDGEGLIQFTQMIKGFEKQSDEVAELNGQLRKIVIPQVIAP